MKVALQINQAAYPDYSKQELADMLGVLPYWVGDYVAYGSDHDLTYHMKQQYGYGDFYEWGGQVLADGTYRADNDEDEDMQFIGRMKTDDGMVYFYPYGVIAMPTDNGYLVTRMD